MPKRHGGYAAFLNMCCSQTCDQAVNKPGVRLAIGPPFGDMFDGVPRPVGSGFYPW
ncbi:hypothetical protein B0G69_6466 [Paraburkholderia sp. RAU2J]|nr:hypothetical protein B0G69_6466 [Paraburkholderia sp. RAU2J]TDN62184.1 hypothetical protein B0G77_5723 [Paraburkholderia sp. BL10I2N1]